MKNFRWTALGLTLALLLTGTGCGGKGGENISGTQEQGSGTYEELVPEYLYVPEYYNISGENVQLYNAVISNGKLYGAGYEYDELTETYCTWLSGMDIAEGEVKNSQKVIAFPQNVSMDQFCMDQQGNFYVVERKQQETEQEETSSPEDYGQSTQPQYFLSKYDSQGNQLYQAGMDELTRDMEWFYVQNMAVDQKGRCYLSGDEGAIYLFDESGAYAGTAKVDGVNWISGMGTGKDGKVYICYNDNSGDVRGSLLTEIDFEKKQKGATYANFVSMNGNGNLIPGISQDFLVGDETGLYEYSLEKQEATRLLSWLDSDINGSHVSRYFAMADGSIAVLVNDWDTGSTEFAVMKKMKSEDVTRAETVVLGTFYSDSSLSSSVVNFNKTNGKYRVVIKSYMDPNSWSETAYEDAINTMNNEIISGNAPDIIALDMVDVSNFVSKGVLEDLSPYLDQSSVVSRKDFLPQVLEASTVNGVLTSIPDSFSLQTMMGLTSLLGSRKGWNITEIMEFAKEHPKGELFQYAQKSSILTSFLIYNQAQFLNREKAECYFDSSEFKSLLQFANTFPEELDYENMDNRLEPLRIADGSLLLVEAYISSFDDIPSYLAYFDGKDVSFIGYPTSQGNGTVMRLGSRYGISSKSQKKEGAWAFMEYLLSRDVLNDWSFYGFSSRKDVFEQQKEKATKVEYVLDENGEPMLDENGEPIWQGGGGWSMSDEYGNEWYYENKPLTREEADMVDDLLQGATSLDNMLDQELMNIVTEEAGSYFAGNKSVDEVAGIIQNRISLYLKENH